MESVISNAHIKTVYEINRRKSEIKPGCTQKLVFLSQTCMLYRKKTGTIQMLKPWLTSSQGKI